MVDGHLIQRTQEVKESPDFLYSLLGVIEVTGRAETMRDAKTFDVCQLWVIADSPSGLSEYFGDRRAGVAHAIFIVVHGVPDFDETKANGGRIGGPESEFTCERFIGGPYLACHFLDRTSCIVTKDCVPRIRSGKYFSRVLFEG